jgi:hypothetical protein
MADRLPPSLAAGIAAGVLAGIGAFASGLGPLAALAAYATGGAFGLLGTAGAVALLRRSSQIRTCPPAASLAGQAHG